MLGTPVNSRVLNDSAWTRVSTACADPQVATAVSGYTHIVTSPVHRALRIHCSTLSLSGELDPATILVAGQLLPVQGGDWSANDTKWAIDCPADNVVVGIGINNDSGAVSEMFLECAPLVYDDSTQPPALVIGTKVRIGDQGGSGTPTDTALCPAGHVAVGGITEAGVFLSSVGLVCRPFSTAAWLP